MAYQTGVASTSSALLAVLKTFAEGNGWTSHDYTLGSSYRLSNGMCYVTINLDGVNNLWLATVSKDHAAVSTDLRNQTGYPGLSDTSSYTMLDVSSVSAYHLFADTGFIHLVLVTASGTYVHFSFGMVDKKGLSHSGAAYISSHRPRYADVNFPGTYPRFQIAPFSSQLMGYAPSAMPATAAWADALASNNGTGLAQRMMPTITLVDDLSGANSTGRQATFCEGVFRCPASSWGGVAVLWSIPTVMLSGNGQMVYLGDYPNVRFVNMFGYAPEQEVVYGSDTFKIFPIVAQGNPSDYGLRYNSGQYAVAYKKT